MAVTKPSSTSAQHASKCKKAHDFSEGGLRRRIDEYDALSQAWDVKKQKKVEEKQAKVAEMKAKLAACRVEFAVRSSEFIFDSSGHLTACMQVAREASRPVTLEDAPSGHHQCRVPAKFMGMLQGPPPPSSEAWSARSAWSS